ncbi:hypothetical protein DFH27DRAFT_576633 [Peziza echinospora]|nr:hypothetical protein DFH27DRAFT_576633 [Peziza echinospora]
MPSLALVLSFALAPVLSLVFAFALALLLLLSLAFALVVIKSGGDDARGLYEGLGTSLARGEESSLQRRVWGQD